MYQNPCIKCETWAPGSLPVREADPSSRAPQDDILNAAGMPGRLLFAEDFERLLAQDAEAGEPAGDDGEGGDAEEGGEILYPEEVVVEFHPLE